MVLRILTQRQDESTTSLCILMLSALADLDIAFCTWQIISTSRINSQKTSEPDARGQIIDKAQEIISSYHPSPQSKIAEEMNLLTHFK